MNLQASFIYYAVASLQVKVIPNEIKTVDLTNDDDNAFDDVKRNLITNLITIRNLHFPGWKM